MKFFMTCIAVALFTSTTSGQHLSEAAATSAIAEKYNARVEVKLWDNTRVDLLSATHAYEVDWAHKYAEGVGQALYYSCLTERKPGLILLVKDLMKEQRFIYRARITCDKAGVDLYVEIVKPAKLSKPAMGQRFVSDDTPVYVYFIYDPEQDKYFKKNTFGLSGWGSITEAEVWTVKKIADSALSGMYGSRASRCVLKKFILIPAKEDK